MKTKLNLFLLFILVVLHGNSQTNPVRSFKEAILKPKKIDTTIIGDAQKKELIKQRTKSSGTILYSEDFANQIPSGWTVTNQAGNSNNWIWSNSAPGGQYSQNVTAINSTTAFNGFMSLRSGHFNTPFPIGGPVAMDTWFTSPAITIPATPSVILQWEQSSRYCCSFSDDLVVEVSRDSINWVAYDAMMGRGANVSMPLLSSDPAEIIQINVSAQLANQTTVYLRWRQTGASHYYWMIDDVKLFAGPANSITLTDHQIDFSDTTINPVLTIVPQLILNPLNFEGRVLNTGSNTQTGMGLEVEVVQDSNYWGASGIGTVDIQSTILGIPVHQLQVNNFNVGPYVNTGNGYYTAHFRAVSATQNQNPSTAYGFQQFIVSDSVLAKDLGPYNGDAGPANYVGGGNNGDRWASLMTIGANARTNGSVLATSISILVANVSTNIGAVIQPRVWYWDDNAPTLASSLSSPPVGSTPDSTTIDASMLGNWITIPLFPPAVLTTNAQYAVGWEQVGGASSGAAFTAARDKNRESIQPSASNFVYVNDASPSWGWVTQLAAVRLNFGNLIIGLDSEKELKTSFSVFPNPNRGQFSLIVTSQVTKSYDLAVRNILGQIIYVDEIYVAGGRKETIGISSLERGIYLVSLENNSEKISKKIIVK